MPSRELGRHPVQRMYGPVRLDKMDRIAQRKTHSLTRKAAEFGGDVIGWPHGASMASLAEGVARELIDGTARNGLVLSRLCPGRAGISRVGEKFAGEALRDGVELGVRSLLPHFGFKAVHEHITSVPVRPNKDMHGFAIDQIPNRSRMGHILLSSVGSDDRTLITQAIWLPTGTTDDRTSSRADQARIDRWSKELGKPLAGSLVENLTEMFEAKSRARRAALAAASGGGGVFTKFGLDPQRFFDECFPRCVIMDRLAFGPPSAKGASSAKVVFPGEDDEIIAVVEAAGSYGIGRCRIEEEREVSLESVERSMLPALAKRFGEEPVPVAQQVLETVADWQVASGLGIGVNVRFVRYWHFKNAGYLLRAVQVPGRGGQLHDVSVWRAIGLDSSHLRETITLIERAHQPWPGSCVDRFVEECAPARMNTTVARQREGLLKTTLLANAGGVSAHRGMELRRAAKDSQRAQVHPR
jgi:hypothetical protein